MGGHGPPAPPPMIQQIPSGLEKPATSVTVTHYFPRRLHLYKTTLSFGNTKLKFLATYCCVIVVTLIYIYVLPLKNFQYLTLEAVA